MKKSEVAVGKKYVAKVSGGMTVVQIISVSPHGGWNAINTNTSCRVYIRSAMRLRREYLPPVTLAKPGAKLTAADQVWVVMKNGEVLQTGSVTEDASGDKVRVIGWRAPKHNGSTGRVVLEAMDGVYLGEFFPGVINAIVYDQANNTTEPYPSE